MILCNMPPDCTTGQVHLLVLYIWKILHSSKVDISYSGLFSRGVNFPKFPEWTCDSGNFILDC